MCLHYFNEQTNLEESVEAEANRTVLHTEGVVVTVNPFVAGLRAWEKTYRGGAHHITVRATRICRPSLSGDGSTAGRWSYADDSCRRMDTVTVGAHIVADDTRCDGLVIASQFAWVPNDPWGAKHLLKAVWNTVDEQPEI